MNILFFYWECEALVLSPKRKSTWSSLVPAYETDRMVALGQDREKGSAVWRSQQVLRPRATTPSDIFLDSGCGPLKLVWSCLNLPLDKNSTSVVIPCFIVGVTIEFTTKSILKQLIYHLDLLLLHVMYELLTNKQTSENKSYNVERCGWIQAVYFGVMCSQRK